MADVQIQRALDAIKDSSYKSVALVTGLLVVVFWALNYGSKGKQLPLPPGPKGRPFVGVARDLPKHMAFLKFKEWSDQYGPFMHLPMGGEHVIVISDGQIARDLLDKRSKIYSDRPPSVIGDIVSRGARSVLMPINNRWRSVRKLFASLLTPTKCDTVYNDWSEREAVITCMDLFNHQDDLKRNLNRFALSVVRSITYGKRAIRRDPIMMDAEEAAMNFVAAFRPGAYIIEYMPWLTKLPEFLQPGVKTLYRYRDMEDAYNMEKWEETKKLAIEHPNRHTIISEVKALHDDPDAAKEMTDMQCAATAMEIVGVGTDTTAATILIMLQGFLEYPETLKKAQEEMDRVIGQDRYPHWSEQDKLPYLRACIKESHRWRTINPLSMSHYVKVEDEYMGYRIPKNSIIRLNTWAIHADPKRFPEPERYNPDRFINHSLSAAASANAPSAKDRDHWGYGNGKRICVGMHLAERNLFNMTSRIVQTFNIEAKLKPDGTKDLPKLEEYIYGLILLPPNFEAKFTFRSERTKALLEREFVTAGKSAKLESWDDLKE